MLSLDLFVAKDLFLKSHPKPQIIHLKSYTVVTNKGKTSDRHPRGDFDNSWMNYWMAFSDITRGFICSVDGNPIWVSSNEESCEICKKWNRAREIMYGCEKDEAEQSYNGRRAHGAHVRYQGKIYIVPMSASENTSLGDDDSEITLKKGTVLVEEVDPIIDDQKK